MWEVEYTDEFESWWMTLAQQQQEALDDRVMLLAHEGPGLGRPVVGKITNSRHANMKELRAAKDGSLRVLFAFDPRRHAILLLGGDKTGNWKRWYDRAIPLADLRYDAHLKEIEGLPVPTTRNYRHLHDQVVARPGASERLAALREETLDAIGLFELRRALGMSQTDVAEGLAVSQAAVSQLERSKDLKVSTLRRYLARLGAQLQLVAVFEEDDEERTIRFTIGDG